MELKKEILKLCAQKGFLLDKEILDALVSFDEVFVKKFIETLSELGFSERVVSRAVLGVSLKRIREKCSDTGQLNRLFISLGLSGSVVTKNESGAFGVNVLSENYIHPKRVEIGDFVRHFKNRYEFLSGILQKKNIKNLKSIRRLTGERENLDLIVMVLEKRITKNKNLILDVEDLTGRSRVLINFSKTDLYNKCKNILPDDVVSLNVSGNREMLFVNDVLFPDCVLTEKKRCGEDILAAFCSDMHVGSKMFLENNFLRFVKWLNGESGDDIEKEFAKKIKYLFLTGDNVDGIGVFPDQEKLLEIKEVKLQYKKLAELLGLVRKDIKIIICSGQHDAVWVGEPQPAIGEKWALDLYKLENVVLVPNPSLVEIAGGLKVLMYHGASFHGIIGEMDDIRLAYGHNSPTTIVKELLERRHLAPSHGICDYVPNETKDSLIINEIPDIVATGDLHRAEISSYNNILLISSSCWQSLTPFEEKVGNNPDPCKVPVFNLKTREIKILDFSGGENEN